MSLKRYWETMYFFYSLKVGVRECGEASLFFLRKKEEESLWHCLRKFKVTKKSLCLTFYTNYIVSRATRMSIIIFPWMWGTGMGRREWKHDHERLILIKWMGLAGYQGQLEKVGGLRYNFPLSQALSFNSAYFEAVMAAIMSYNFRMLICFTSLFSHDLESSKINVHK